jgi:hypothetical protein
MSKEYDLSTLKVVCISPNSDVEHTILSEDVDKYNKEHGARFWDSVSWYVIYWERNGCSDKFFTQVFNPNKIPELKVNKWLTEVYKSEGSYKAESFDAFKARKLGKPRKSLRKA